MNAFEIFLFVYILLGSFYAFYTLIIGSTTLLSLPINILGGPIVVLYHFIKALFYKPRNHNL